MDDIDSEKEAKARLSPRRPNGPFVVKHLTGGGVHLRRVPVDGATGPAALAPAPSNVDKNTQPVRTPSPSNVDKKTHPAIKPVSLEGLANVDIIPTAGVSKRQAGTPRASITVTPPKSNVDNTPRVQTRDEDEDLPTTPARWHRVGVPEVVDDNGNIIGGRSAAVPGPDMDKFGEIRRAVQARLSDRVGERLTPVGILGSPQGSTRTAATVAAYERRGRQLENRYRKWINVDQSASINPIEFAQWVLSLKVGWTASAWRTYKQAAIHVLTRIEHGDSEEARHMLDRETGWDAEMAVKTKKPTGRVTATGRAYVDSATKAKDFDYQDFFRLDAFLQVKAWSKHAQTLRDWLRAGLATGLRPDEWQASEVSTWHDSDNGIERTFLFVMNAKATNGRANGQMRTLDITNFSTESMNAVMRMAERGREWSLAGKFDDMQDRCAQMLYRADAKLWPKRTTRTYALYSCRHQFILNMRSIERTEVEISAMLGHTVTDTQLTHYGKRGRGWSIDKIIDRPSPIEMEIATVRLRLDMHSMKERLDNLIDSRKPKMHKMEGDLPLGDPGLGEILP